MQVDGEGAVARVAWPFPTPWRSAVEAVGLGRLNDRHEDYVIGSVLLVRSEALEQVGGFDDDFFLYAEETDWARRASLMGWRHSLVTAVAAVHIGAGTSNDPDRRETHFHAGRERYFRKHHGVVGWTATRGVETAGALARSLVLDEGRARSARRRARILLAGPRRLERRAAAERVAL